jgi:hypothetical protein
MAGPISIGSVNMLVCTTYRMRPITIGSVQHLHVYYGKFTCLSNMEVRYLTRHSSRTL